MQEQLSARWLNMPRRSYTSISCTHSLMLTTAYRYRCSRKKVFPQSQTCAIGCLMESSIIKLSCSKDFYKKIIETFAISKNINTFASAIDRVLSLWIKKGALVQLVRMPACHAGGHESESRTHRINPLRSSP